MNLNKTHDPERRSWVESANGHDQFPIQNLPFGVFARRGDTDSQRAGVAIGDYIFDVAAGVDAGLFEGDAARAAESCRKRSLNRLMSLGAPHWRALRERLSEILAAEGEAERARAERCLVAMDDAEMRMPVEVGDYTDFYASVYHATNVGSMFRPDNPLLPNYKYIPVAYHGRASSIILSGEPVRRPLGQTRPDEGAPPTFGPCRLLDYELEVGMFVGPDNARGKGVAIGDASETIFGLCLVNDWSARDIQKWEYQPLGPFLSKSFATSISPWIVTTEALAPFRRPAFQRPDEDPAPLPHLFDENDQAEGGVDIVLDVYLESKQMRERGLEPQKLTTGNFADMYWTMAQMVAHHTSNGCNLRPGDLLASGTVSGQDKGSRGCLLELTWRGSEPVQLATGEERKFLADGDCVIIRGRCQREGAVGIGFGICEGTIHPSPPLER